MNEGKQPAKSFTPTSSEFKTEAPATRSRENDLTDVSTIASSSLRSDTGDPLYIGPYRLLRILGEGGMGRVWLAQQMSPVNRQVALKIIKAGRFDSSALQRFEVERQSLAIMDHPAIAKIFDAGATSEGQPYFVMECVAGLPITNYCDQKKLTIRERLTLFIKVCEGVQHAHQKAIIHRDLKPSNILVVEVDGKPMPRIIDFGIAKATWWKETDQTLVTQFGVMIGTPGYFSPEQADLTAVDIDTRTDVYSLGVVLYELLTGFLPLDATGWKKQRAEEFLRRLREEDPPRPSTKISTNREASADRAQVRSTEAKQLAHSLRGDLDCITMKALEKDRERRYATPSELAVDLEHYLKNQPVTARPASIGYRTRKYMRRHAAGVAVALGAALLLVAFAVMQAVQLRRITRERDRADRVTDFMTGMFEVSDPNEARGNTITAREILDKAAKDIQTGMAKDPALQAQLMDSMGKVYLNLGLFPKAQALFEQALKTRQQLFGIRNRATLESMDRVGWILTEEGQYQEAEKIERQVLPLARKILGPEDKDTLTSALNLATDLYGEGRLVESEKLDRETIAIRRRLWPEDKDTLIEMSNHAITLEDLGHYREAEGIFSEVLKILYRTQGPEHPYTIKVRSNLADVYEREGRLPEAEMIIRELLEVRTRVLGPDHLDTLTNRGDVASLLYEQGRYAEAEILHREVLAREEAVAGVEHFRTLATMSNLSDDLTAEGRYPEAERLIRQVIETRRRVLGPDHPDTMTATISLASLYRKEGRYDEAEELTRATLERQRKVLGESHPSCALSVYNLAAIAAAKGDRENALELLRSAVDHKLETDVVMGIENDPDLKVLHGDPRFEGLVREAKERAAPSTR